MNIDLKLDPEQLNQAIAEAVIKSSLGKMVKDAIEDLFKNLRNDYKFKDTIDVAIRTEVSNIIVEQVHARRDEIAEIVKGKLTDQFLADNFAKIWDKATRERY